RVNPDGTVTMFWSNPTKVPTAPVDRIVSVLRVDSEDGTPLAILVNYACHPVIFGADNLQYSADYPGVMTQTVEKAFDGKPLCMFLQGAPGDINVYNATTPLEQDPVEFQINWRDRCPTGDAFFLGYANGYYGYFPTIQAATEGGYGAASATTWMEVGAGERMVNHALVRLYEMLGRLTDLPEDLKKK